LPSLSNCSVFFIHIICFHHVLNGLTAGIFLLLLLLLYKILIK